MTIEQTRMKEWIYEQMNKQLTNKNEGIHLWTNKQTSEQRTEQRNEQMNKYKMNEYVNEQKALICKA